MTREKSTDDGQRVDGDAVLVYGGDLTAPDYDAAFSCLQARFRDAPLRFVQSPRDAVIGEIAQPVVIFLRSPDVSLALALEERIDPVRALDAWASAQEALVAVFHRARRRVTLVDIALLDDPDQRAFDVLCRRLNADMSRETPGPVGTSRKPTPVHHAAAKLLIQSDERASAVTKELNLAMLRHGSAAPTADTVATLLTGWGQLLSEQDSLKRELVLLREAATLSCDMSEQLEDQKLLRAENDALKKRLEAQKKAEHRTRSILGNQLLEDARTLAKVETRQEMNARALVQVETELQKVVTSKSWRMTAPVREARRWLTFKGRS